MKKVAFIFLVLVSFTVKSQVLESDYTIQTKNYGSYDISEIADDTVYWFRVRGSMPISIQACFTNFNTDDAIADFYTGKTRNDSIYYNSIDGLTLVDFPLTLSKTEYLSRAEGDTTHCVEVIGDFWKSDLIGVFLDPGTATSGTYTIFIDR